MKDWLYERVFKMFMSEDKIASHLRHLLSSLSGVLLGFGVEESLAKSWVEATSLLLAALASYAISYYFSRKQKQAQ